MNRKFKLNTNKIVRVRNKTIWELVRHAAWQTGLPHQVCFDELMDMVSEGFVIGSQTSFPLFQRLTEKINNEK